MIAEKPFPRLPNVHAGPLAPMLMVGRQDEAHSIPHPSVSTSPSSREGTGLGRMVLFASALAVVSALVAALAPSPQKNCGPACGAVPIITADRASDAGLAEGRSVAQMRTAAAARR